MEVNKSVNLQNRLRFPGLLVLAILVTACAKEPERQVEIEPLERAEVRPEIYADFTLTADLGHLNTDQKQMIVLLIEAADIMDDLFWRQSYGDDYRQWLDSIGDERARRFEPRRRRRPQQVEGCNRETDLQKGTTRFWPQLASVWRIQH